LQKQSVLAAIICPPFDIVKYKKTEKQPRRFMALIVFIFICAAIM